MIKHARKLMKSGNDTTFNGRCLIELPYEIKCRNQLLKSVACWLVKSTLGPSHLVDRQLLFSQQTRMALLPSFKIFAMQFPLVLENILKGVMLFAVSTALPTAQLSRDIDYPRTARHLVMLLRGLEQTLRHGLMPN
jgi:hypothetical protein